MKRSRPLGDVQPMLAAIAKTAARLCDANDAVIRLVEGNQTRLVARYGRLGTFRKLGETSPLTADLVVHRAILERRTIHVRDLAKTPRTQFVDSKARQLPRGRRTILATPLLHDGAAIGAIFIRRTKVRPFTPKQIALLKTFADQAAIAIENARLSQALEARNADLSEALEQQTATSEILRVISSSPTDIRPVLETVVHAAARFCGATNVALLSLDGGVLRGAAAAGQIGEEIVRRYGSIEALEIPVTRESVSGRAVVERRTMHIHDLAAEPESEFPVGRELQRQLRHRTSLATPLLREGTPIGAILLFRTEVKPFSDKQLQLLQTFADQAVIAIENVRLFTELEARNRDLTEALEQQTATSEILRVISGSPTDVQPVFDAIVASAMRLCGGRHGTLYRRHDDMVDCVAQHNVIPEIQDLLRRAFPRPVTTGSSPHFHRALLEGTMESIPDIEADPDLPRRVREVYRSHGMRSVVMVPLLGQREVLGVLVVGHGHVAAFSDRHMALLQTFADQAVIAIENVRLFKELEVRNRDLTVALEQQTATSEILRVISSSQTDVQPVFETMAANALRLCDAKFSAIFRFDGELLHLGAHHNVNPEGIAALRDAFPMPPGRGSNSARAILTRSIVHIPDVREDSEYALQGFAQTVDYRSILSVPILRDGQPMGVISVGRAEARPFPNEQVELLKTFADQALIAIENVRLFTELEARNSELRVALEQQTATSELLKVIGRSTFDLHPVFETLAENAVRLCEAERAFIWRPDGQVLRAVVMHNATPGLREFAERNPIVPGRDSGTARAALERHTVHIPDALADPEYTFGARQVDPIRTVLAIPMLRADELLGVIAIYRLEVRPFTGGHIALMETFADQAAIAIENARLLNELQAKNADLTEALEQQTATSEILRVISSSPTDVQPVFDTIVGNAVNLCGARMGAVYRFDGELVHLAAHHNYPPEALEILRRIYPRPPQPDQVAGRAILARAVAQIEDVLADPLIPREIALAGRWRSILAVPMLHDGAPIGAIVITRSEEGPFAAGHVELLKTFADQAVIAVENVRLFKELEARNRDLTVALEQQTATSEILRVISSSQTDVQPVFDTIVRSAVRLCDGLFSALFQFDGELIYQVAQHNYTSEALEAQRRVYPMRPIRGAGAARAILERAVVHIPDVEVDPEYQHQAVARAIGFRSGLYVPMLREGAPIGVIMVARAEAGPFSDNEIELLKTFADQAVIAVENVRLFKELQARTGELTRSVEQLTALGEISRAVSSTLDVETVLDTIVSRASQLAGADACAIYEYDEMEQVFHVRATHNFDAAFVATLRAMPLHKGEGVLGRATETRQPIQIADIAAPGAYESQVRDLLIGAGYRAALSVPLLREEQIIGSLSLTRKVPGEFSPEVIEVLKTFATQSALAIQNARLFREIADKSRQLEVASRHKSEFLANMSHELRTPLNAIIGFSEVLNERMFGELNPKQEEYLKDIHASGQHLLSLINDILDLSKIEAGRMELELTDFDLPNAIDNALILVRERATRRGITLGSRIDERLGLIGGDERKVKQVLLNLLSNALKFTPEGGRIDVSATLRDGVAEVSVSDTGVGIAPEDQDAVFEEFRQVGGAEKKAEGTGLGLALSRKFVELHGGRIWVQSQIGVGSTFTFTLPVKPRSVS